MASRKSKKSTTSFDLETISTQATAWIGSIQSLVFHTTLFIGAFVLGFAGIDWDRVLLVLTTVVSLEAIYLAIFIQMTVNRNTQSLKEVEQDIDEIQQDVDTIQENVDEIQEDVDEIQQDVDEVQHDVDEIQHDVDEIQEDVVEMTESDREDDKADVAQIASLETIKAQIEKLAQAVEALTKK